MENMLSSLPAMLNWILIFLIAVYVMQGFYKGFLVSVGNLIGMVLSWLVGFMFSPLLSQSIADSSFYSFLVNLTTGSARLGDTMVGNLPVSALGPQQIDQIVSNSSLPYPFSELVQQNMDAQAFAGKYTTVNQYFDYTVANVVVNIFSFLMIYLIARVVISLLINAVNFASPLPVLKKFDSTIGGGVGFVRGFLGMFAITMIVPVILIAAPTGVTLFSDILEGSSLTMFFYNSNFLLGFISGVI